jgi:hypothetical protein
MSKLLLGVFALTWFGLSYATTPRQDYIGVVSAEAAYASLLPGSAPVNPPKPVDPKNCPTCGGTGKVRTGDGQGWTKCPTCQPASDAKPVLKQTVPPGQGFPPRSVTPPLSGNCPDGTCPLRVYQMIQS